MHNHAKGRIARPLLSIFNSWRDPRGRVHMLGFDGRPQTSYRRKRLPE